MRKATIIEYNKLADKLANYVAAMNYRFMDLCVKAEPVALLGVTPTIDGEVTKLEDCAKVGKSDEYTFMVIPNFDEDMTAIQRAIVRVHPEFKMDTESIKVNSVDDDGKADEMDVRYLKLRMPEVDDDRHDVLQDGVKLLYEECKALMATANTMAKAKFTELAPGETKEDLERLDKALKKLNDQWDAQREEKYQNKIDEIDQAYNKWLANQAQREIAQMEDDDARGAGTNIKLSNMYDQ